MTVVVVVMMLEVKLICSTRIRQILSDAMDLHNQIRTYQNKLKNRQAAIEALHITRAIEYRINWLKSSANADVRR